MRLTVLGIRQEGSRAEHPDITAPLPAGAELIRIGDREAAQAFFGRRQTGLPRPAVG